MQVLSTEARPECQGHKEEKQKQAVEGPLRRHRLSLDTKALVCGGVNASPFPPVPISSHRPFHISPHLAASGGIPPYSFFAASPPPFPPSSLTPA